MTPAPPEPRGVEVQPLEADRPPEPGELKIKERRSWRTWQLLVVALLAAVFGMWINGDTGGGASSTTGTGTTSGTLPPASSSTPDSGASTTTTTAAGASSSGSSTTTTAASGSTTTTAAGDATTTPSTSAAAAGPARVLLTSPQLQGNWTSPAFTTTAAAWNIGWAFRCAPAPAAGPSFQVFVVPSGSQPSGTAAISETGPSGQSVTAQSTLGAQMLVVQAPASCTWVVKVTGS